VLRKFLFHLFLILQATIWTVKSEGEHPPNQTSIDNKSIIRWTKENKTIWSCMIRKLEKEDISDGNKRFHPTL
jgi:hypothetical protein